MLDIGLPLAEGDLDNDSRGVKSALVVIVQSQSPLNQGKK
jgi:hypothetical protein